MTTPKMMPGQEPYTPEEWKTISRLVAAAAQATEEFSEDELEAYYNEQLKKEKQ